MSRLRLIALALALQVSITPIAQAVICGPFLWRLSGALGWEPPVQWKSRLLGGVRLSSLSPDRAKQRVREIVDAIYDPKSALGLEIDNYLGVAMTSSTEWLNHYFRSYEIFFWSPSYQKIVERVHADTAANANILDVGSATGGLGGMLATGSDARTVTFLDSGAALDILKSRMPLLFPGGSGRFDTLPVYLGPRTRLPEKTYDTAVVNHVLYTMQPAAKEGGLKAVVDRLGSGSTLLVNEPVKDRAGDEAAHREWLTKIMEEAVVNGAPQTDFHVAMLAAIASGRATKGARGGQPLQNPYQTRDEHEALFKKLGLVIEASEPTYDGFSRYWKLRKP